MDQTTIQVISMLLVLLTLVIIAIPARKRSLRPIRAYTMIPSLAGRAIESNQPLHISLGGSGIGGEATLLTLASADLAYAAAERATYGDVSPIITLSDGSALPVGQDVLRRVYQASGREGGYRATNVRWYPSGARSLAFAAALTVSMQDDRFSSNVMAGRYGAELALVLAASHRRALPAVAVSDRLEGQAVAYALADAPLIGEEVFMAAAYLDRDPRSSGRVVAMDLLRWALILVLLVGLIVKLGEGG